MARTKVYGVYDAAEAIGVSVYTIKDWIKVRRITFQQINGKGTYVFTQEDIDEVKRKREILENAKKLNSLKA